MTDISILFFHIFHSLLQFCDLRKKLFLLLFVSALNFCTRFTKCISVSLGFFLCISLSFF
ncbi:MAG: hypothetical protein ED554_05695 [Synechococcus sp. YX04-3]|nr:MAG: hypothetical protein ED554_05695 [Synechococcus sp. YX04-3]